MGDRNGPKFEMVRRNVYSGKDRPKRMARDEIAVCSCSVTTVTAPDGAAQRTGCGDSCLNRVMKIHCDPKTCPCGDACANKPFHMLKPQAMEIFLTTNNRGHGVRAARPISRGEFVVEYAGEVIDSREMRRRMDAQRQLGQHHFYIMGLGPGMFIDAHKRGNLARLLNSSCEPNCETQKWYDAATGEMRVGIFAMRDIVPGEELTYDYMFEHEGGSALAQGFRCMCGAPKCRGTMDVNPERKRDYGRRLEVFWEGDRAWYAGTVTGYFVTSGKHAVLYDDGDTERLALSEVPHRWLDGQGAGVVQGPAAKVPAGAEPPPIALRGKKAKAAAAVKEEEEDGGSSSGGEGGRAAEKGRRGSGAAARRRDSGGGAARAPKRAAVVVSSPEGRGKSGGADRRRQKQRRASGADANGGSSASTQTGLLPGPEAAAMEQLVAAAAAGTGAPPPQSPRTAGREGGDAKAEVGAAAGNGGARRAVQHTTRSGLSALDLLAAKEDADCAVASALPPAARRRRGRRAADGEGLLPVAQLLAGISAVRAKGPELFCPSVRAQARSALTAAYGTGAVAAAAAAGGAYTAGKFRQLLERVAALEAAEGPAGEQAAPGDECGDASDDGEGDAAEIEAAGALRRLSGGGSLPQPLPPLFCAAPATAGGEAAAAARRGSGAGEEAAAASGQIPGGAAATSEATEEGAAAAAAAAGPDGAAEAAGVDADAAPEARRCESPAGPAASGGDGPEQEEAPEPPPGPPRMDAGRQGPPVAA